MALDIMPRVKICGITSVQDALHAAGCGADALGLVFYPDSPRCVTRQLAREIIAELPPFVVPVGLFVNCPVEEIGDTAAVCGFDTVQLHGDETPDDCRLAPLRVIKALRVRGQASLAGIDEYPVVALLLDAWVPGSYGGTGKTFNWQLAAAAAQAHRVVLAGGLTPDNVVEAVRAVRPYAVDVSSGVERAPGRKDPDLVAAFVRNVKYFMER
jgi:phosphoribosylanthranilate isomerase